MKARGADTLRESGTEKKQVSPDQAEMQGSAGRPAHLARAHIWPLCKLPCSVPTEQIREEGGGPACFQLLPRGHPLGWGHHALCPALRPGAAAGMPVARSCASPSFPTHAVNSPFTQLFSLNTFDRDSIWRPWLSPWLREGSSGIWEGCGNARVLERSMRGRRVEGSLQKRRWGDSRRAPSFPN